MQKDRLAKAISPRTWMNTLARSLLYTATAILAPVEFSRKKPFVTVTLAKTAIFVGAMFIPDMAALTMPSAEKYLKQEGLPVTLKEEIVPDKKVRIGRDNAAGYVYAFFSTHPVATLLGRNNVWNAMRDPAIAGFALHDRGIAMIKHGQLIAPEKLEYIVAHELRHMTDENKALPAGLARESDAIYHGMKAVHNDALRQRLLRSMKGVHSPEYDAALYVDAMFNNRARVAPDDMHRANVEAAGAFKSFIIEMLDDTPASRAMLDCHFNAAAQTPCRMMLDGKPLDPLTQRRLGFYLDSLRDEGLLPPAFREEKKPAPPVPALM